MNQKTQQQGLTKVDTIRGLLEKMRPEIQKVLLQHLEPGAVIIIKLRHILQMDVYQEIEVEFPRPSFPKEQKPKSGPILQDNDLLDARIRIEDTLMPLKLDEQGRNEVIIAASTIERDGGKFWLTLDQIASCTDLNWLRQTAEKLEKMVEG